MPLDEFKTQVLLLHSEQSTLDSLSSGFSDRYTVHCATSGSEALNTLVETPINVIVTAQDLPGMSGLEALREARKRSPDTIGILLAGDTNRGLEALVGDEEVFQVVRGNVTGDSISKLVDNATRQMRLMALAESANDTAANVDEPVSQHIVMETSENGSTIISDGTGSLPILDPKKVSAAAAVGARSVDVLVLTKDQEFLETIKDSSRGMHTVHYANTLAQANEKIRDNKVGVAVVDAAMVGDKIEQLTLHLRKSSPRLVSIVAGRRDDGEMLMDLINRGKVYRFLMKPVSPGRARLAVEASVKHHLEAPDAAFKVKGAPAATKPAAKSAPKAVPKPVAKAAPADDASTAQKPEPKAAPAAAREKPAQPVPQAPADPPLGEALDVSEPSPVDAGLSDAFGDSDSSFTETVTGLISTIGDKFSGGDAKEPSAKKAKSEPAAMKSKAKPAQAATADAGSGGGSFLQNPKLLAIGAVAVIVVAGALFWLMSGSDDVTDVTDVTVDERPVAASPQIAPAETGEPEVAEPPAAAGVDSGQLADEARLARDAGQIFNPPGSNAIESYLAAVAADPGNVALADELGLVLTEALSLAETALLESRLDDAAAALQRVRLADPDNARLPFLTAQLSQIQLRNRLSEARAAIRESRFEDATAAIASARALDVADTSEIDAVAAELSSARSEQRAEDVLAMANARLEDGALLSPANDNARYYFELALENDPGNSAAQQGLNVVASKLVLQARAEIDGGNFSAAEDLLDDARALDPLSRDLAATAGALSNARDEIAAQRRQAEQDRLAAEARAQAEREAAAQRAADEAAAAQAAADKLAAEEAAAAERQAAADAAAKPVEESTAAATPAPQPVAAQPAQQVTAPVLAGVSSLKRTRYAAPKYPRSAQRRNLSGWVDVVFTVAMDGTVKDIDVRDSEPDETFVNSAVKAVEKWEFEPVRENGTLVEKRVGVRMMFALE